MFSDLSQQQQKRLKASKYGPTADVLQLVDEVEDASELHLFALNWNWGDAKTIEVMQKIIRHPSCDRATALMIYWSTDGVFCAHADASTVPEWEREVYDLAMEIERKMSAQAFCRQEI